MLGEYDIGYSLISAVREGRLVKVKELVNYYGLSYSSVWSQGYSLLCDALYNRHADVAKFLLTNGSKVNSTNRSVNTPLHYAASLDEIEIVEMIIGKGGYLDVKNNLGQTPLHMAVRAKNMKITELLLKNGADVNVGTNVGIRPIHIATMMESLEIIELLLKYGTSLNHVCTSIGSKDYTPLHFAVEKDNKMIVELLISKGAIVNCQDEDDNTPLHIAAKKGYKNIAEYLLNHGACVNSITFHEGYTPLHFACKQGHARTVNVFLNRGADINIRGTNNATPLHIATENGQASIVKLLLKHGAAVDYLDSEGKTALYLAVEGGYVKIVEHILKYYPDLNNKSNKSSINVAVQEGYGRNYQKIVEVLFEYGFRINIDEANNPKLLHAVVRKGYLNIIEELLKCGANVNTLDTDNDCTLLHTAIEYEQEKITKLLISYEADINVPNKSGKPPIFYAILNSDLKIFKILLSNGANTKYSPKLLHLAVKQNCIEIVDALLQNGADINSRDNYGRTALHFFAEGQGTHTKVEIVKLLISKGANVDAQAIKGVATLHIATKEGFEKVVKVLLEYKANVNISTKTGVTPLHLSAKTGNEEITRMLLNKGADINAKERNGLTPLHIATLKGHVLVVKTLLEYGANVNSKLKHGTTPLHLASENGDPKIIKIILKFGADIDSRDKYGKTALHNASREIYGEAVKCLLDYGSDINVKCRKKQTPLDYAIAGIRSFYYYYRSLDGTFFAHNPSKCEEIAKILKCHIIKLKAANRYVSKNNLLAISLLTISSSDDNNDFKIECEEEIENMKSEKITHTISYYDILAKSTISLAMYMKNENIVQVLKTDDYKSKFPIYASMIETHFRNAMKRNELLKHVSKVFHLLFNNYPELPYDCTEKILGYLSVKHLRNLIDACKPY